MCQLNVFLIFKKIPIDSVMNLMTDSGIQGDCVTDDFKSIWLSSDYNFFITPAQRCHCDSFVSKFTDDQYKSENLKDILTKQHNDELRYYYDMKAFMSNSGYTKDREIFLKAYNELQPKVLSRENDIFKRYENFTDLHTKIKIEIDNSPVHKEFRDLLSNNHVMYDSLMHYSKDFNSIAEDIDELIDKAAKEKFKYEHEYLQLKNWILKLADSYGEVIFLSLWQDNSEPKIQSIKVVTCDQLSFELFAKLNYDELLTISK